MGTKEIRSANRLELILARALLFQEILVIHYYYY